MIFCAVIWIYAENQKEYRTRISRDLRNLCYVALLYKFTIYVKIND